MYKRQLVAHIVKKFDPNPQDIEDLISIGSIGLVKAINTYCQDKGTRLATYASKCIENEILMHLRAVSYTHLDVYKRQVWKKVFHSVENFCGEGVSGGEFFHGVEIIFPWRGKSGLFFSMVWKS